MPISEMLREKYEQLCDWFEEHNVKREHVPLVLTAIGILLILLFISTKDFFWPSQQNVVLKVKVEDQFGNPIEGASVVAWSDEFESPISSETDSRGIATLEVPANVDFELEVSYKRAVKSLRMNLSEDETRTVVLELEELATVDRRVVFFKDETSEKVSVENFQAYCTLADWSFSGSAPEGEAMLKAIPKGCGTLVIELADQQFEIPSLDEPVFRLSVEVKEEKEKASILVLIKDAETKEPISGISVVLLDSYMREVQAPKESDESGSVLFDSVEVGEYAVKVLTDGIYEEKVSGFKEVSSGKQVIFTLELKKVPSYLIKVRVLDTNNNAVDAEFELRDLNDILVASKFTDERGEAIFNVPSKKPYTLIVKKGLWRKSIEVEPRDEFYEIIYNKKDLNRYIEIEARVLDDRNKAVQNVKIKLYKADTNTSTGIECTTASDGTCKMKAPAGSYYAIAFRTNTEPAKSETFELTTLTKEPFKITLVIKIPRTEIIVSVKSSAGKIIDKVRIRAFEIPSENILFETETDVNGTAKTEIESGKIFYLEIEKEGFMKYVTVPYKALPNETIAINAMLYRKTGKVYIKFLGFEINDANVANSLASGQEYEATFLLFVPENVNRAGIFLRTGKAEEYISNLVYDDPLFISDYEATSTKALRGYSYTPPAGEEEDLKNISVDEAKWLLLEWENASGAVYEAKVRIILRDSASSNENAIIAYRAYAVKNNTWLRDPEDAELGSSESTETKQGLYANSYEKVYGIGQTEICENNFCYKFSIEDVEKNKEYDIFALPELKLKKRYKLNFEISNQGSTISDAYISFESSQKAISIESYEIITPLKEILTGTVKGNASVSIGRFPAELEVKGSFTFTTELSGSDVIKLSLLSRAQELFAKEITINIEKPRDMQIDVSPKTLLPYTENAVVARIMDANGSPISEASVNVFLNNELIASGLTDPQGIFSFVVSKPEPKAELRIEVSKARYNDAEITLTVGGLEIEVQPDELQAELQKELKEKEELSFTIKNNSELEFILRDIIVSDLNGSYISIEGLEAYKGMIIAPNESKDVELTLKLLASAPELTEEKEVSIYLSLEFKAPEIEPEISKIVMLKVIILPKSPLDYGDCLSIEPPTWNISGFNHREFAEFTLRNECSADGSAVKLRDLTARVKWRGKAPFGKFSVLIEDSGKRIELDGKQILLDSVPENAELTMIVEFVPNEEIKNAEGEPTIVFEAAYISVEGKQKVKTELNTSLKLSLLANCISIEAPEKLELDACPKTTGFALAQNYFDYDPYAEKTAWPNAFEAPEWYSQDTGNENATNCREKLSITLSNDCVSDVDVKVKVQEGISTSKGKFSLDAGEEKSFDVIAGSEAGSFSVKILARPKGSREDYRELTEIEIKVSDPTIVLKKCKPFVQPKIIKPGFLGLEKVTLTIYNPCYELGVKLQELKHANIHCYSAFNNSEDMHGSCELIKSVRAYRPKLIEVDRKQWELERVDMWYDPSVAEKIGGKVDIGTVLGRALVSGKEFYKALEIEGAIAIPIYIEKLGTKYYMEDVKFEYPLAWLVKPKIEPGKMQKGSQSLRPEECLNRDALNLPANGIEALGDEHFNKSETYVWGADKKTFEWVLPVPSNESEAERYCGWNDYINKIGMGKYEDKQSGVKLYFRLANSRHNIVMTIDRSEMITACARIQFELPVWVTRVHYNAGTERTTIPVVVNVLNKGVAYLREGCETTILAMPPSWLNVRECSETETGERAYLYYGFDKLLFTWDKEDIGESDCDAFITENQTAEQSSENTFESNFDIEVEHFCESSQFEAAMEKKLEKLKKIMERVVNEPMQKGVLEWLSYNPETGKPEKIALKGLDIVRVLKAQIPVEDDSAGGAAYFFTAPSPETLNYHGFLPAMPAQDCPIEEIDRKAGRQIFWTPTEFENVLWKCFNGEVTGDDVLFIIKGEIENTSIDNSLITAGVMESLLTESNSYVLTYNEFLDLWEKFKEQSTGKEKTDEITIPVKSIENNEITIKTIAATKSDWENFFNALRDAQKVDVVIGLINKPNLSENTLLYVLYTANDGIAMNIPPKEVETLLDWIAARKLDKAKGIAAGVYKYASSVTFLPITSTTPINWTFSAGYEQSEFELAGRTKKYISLEEIDSINENETAYANNPLFYVQFEPKECKKTQETIKLPLVNNMGKIESVGVSCLRSRYVDYTYLDNYRDTRSGKVFELLLASPRAKMKYSPSVPALVTLISDSEIPNTVFYTIKDSGGKEIFSQSDEQLAFWQSAEASEYAVGANDEVAKHVMPSYCTIKGKVLSAKLNITQGVWNAVPLYIPSERGAIYFEVLCSRDKVELVSVPACHGNVSENVGLPRVPLAEMSMGMTLKQYLELVREGRVCVSATNNKLVLRWNPNACSTG